MSQLQFQTMTESESCGAEFSVDRKRRLVLWRKWDEEKPMVMFIGLNPSIANEHEDDPTIRRVKGFARDWGYGGFYMLNLFTQVTPKPEELVAIKNQMTDFRLLRRYSEKSKLVVFAWGNFKEAIIRGEKCATMLPGAMSLGLNSNGSPKHPLYIPANAQPFEYLKVKNCGHKHRSFVGIVGDEYCDDCGVFLNTCN